MHFLSLAGLEARAVSIQDPHDRIVGANATLNIYGEKDS